MNRHFMKCPVAVGTEGAEGEGLSQLVQSVSSCSTVDVTESWCPDKTGCFVTALLRKEELGVW